MFEQRGRQRRPFIFRTLIALALFAPLPFGSFPTWAWTIIVASIGMLLFGWGVLALAGRTAVVCPPFRVWWCAPPFALAILWATFQTLGFSPESWHHPIWRGASEALGLPYAGSISLNPAASKESILRITSYVGAFWLAIQFGRDPACAWYVLRALAIGSACYALYGLVVQFSGANVILWFRKAAFLDTLSATFVNPNSFATYAGLGLLCTTAAIRQQLNSVKYAAPNPRERLRLLIDEFLPQNGLLLGGWLMLAVALMLSESRGGVAATVLALSVFFSVLAARYLRKARGLALRATLPLLAAAALFGLSGEGLQRQFLHVESDWLKRMEIYGQTVKAIEDTPLLGTGLGTFESVYRRYRTEEIRPGIRMAHNDYLELALELGIPAAAIFIFGFVALALNCAVGVFVRRRDAVFPAVGLAACVLTGGHALVDFSLHIPAVALGFALVLGVTVAQCWRTNQARLVAP